MTAPELRKGERVTVTVDGEVAHTYPGHIALTTDGGGWVSMSTASIDAGAAEVVRQAPAQWPPKPGDVWLATDGGTWFAFENKNLAAGVVLAEMHYRARGMTPSTWQEQYGPGTLAYRVGYEMPVGWYDQGGSAAVLRTVQVVDDGMDVPGGWMQPGVGSAYVRPVEDAPAPDPDVEMVQPDEVSIGQTIRLPIRRDAEVTDIDRGDLETTFYYEGEDGAERTVTIHHGGAVARVRTGGPQ